MLRATIACIALMLAALPSAADYDTERINAILAANGCRRSPCDLAPGTTVGGAPIGGGSGEVNTGGNLGGGLANYDSKSGVQLRFNSFAAADFDLTANLLTIDPTKWLTITAGNAAYAPINPTLGTQTQGNYVESIATTAPLTGGAAGSEGGILTLGLNQNAGTNIANDLEEEAHASEHQHGGADEIASATPAANTIVKSGAIGAIDVGWIPSSVALDSEVTAYAQPLDADLTSMAALATTPHGRGLLDDADQAASRTSIDAQQADADLTNIAALTTTTGGRSILATTPADDQVYVGDSANAGTWRTLPPCANGTTSKLLYDQATNAFSCGTDQSAAGGPTILGGDVPCSVSASYCTIWTIAGSGITASRPLVINALIMVDTDSTTVAAQFRTRTADAGYTGNCSWIMHESTTATTAPASDIVAIGSAPTDTAGTTWFSTAPQPVQMQCTLLADGTPGDIVVEWQLETGTTPTQNVLRGSYYTLTQ